MPTNNTPPPSPIQHDSAHKLMFSEPVMVRSLMQDLIAEAFVDELDFDTLERLPGEHIARSGQKKFSDIVWKVQRKGRSGAPCYIAILLEFQSTPDAFMALRLLSYTALLLEHLTKEPEVQQSGRLPPVLPIVLYNGSRPWSGAVDVADLFAPMPEGLRPFNPRMRYFLLEERAVPQGALQADSLAAQLVRLEQAGDQEAIQEAVGAFLAGLPDESRDALTAALTLLVANSLKRLGVPVPEHFDLRKEQPMLAETMERWKMEAQEKGRAEGIAEGRAEGIAEGRLEGRAEGRMEGSRDIARQLLRMEGFTPEVVARITSLDVEEVQRLAAQTP